MRWISTWIGKLSKPLVPRGIRRSPVLTRWKTASPACSSSSPAAGTYHKLYLDECHTLKDSHEPGLKAHAAKKRSILGLTGTPPAQPHSEKGQLVATYCPILVD
jgi:hypothetical protein